ncbi:MAG: heavy-metal-associated domain-containing protein [Candidatus Latescibacteria bacterium]|jgi:copper chaperone CopZ|nr:heavy-metal-associated domain-containing protein [Candidatus Latescibacterota bacterium]MBT7372342.1 heavy-metal-associated domain-containing protein [Gammaproteobacteria bacterium]
MFGKTEKLVITVGGMSCGHCEGRVEKAVMLCDGIKKAKASHSERTVKITHAAGSVVNMDEVRAAITELGFQME